LHAPLTRASEESALRPDALYNRGNGALAANQLDAAIEDYITMLKIRPKDKDAKRNLEIARIRRQSSQRRSPQPPSQQKPDPQQQDHGFGWFCCSWLFGAPGASGQRC
jgi:predicted TPR repeat methyltransferase